MRSMCVGVAETGWFNFGCVSGCEHSEMGFVSARYCSNTSSVAVNRATFSRWRRLIKPISTDRLHRFSLCHLKSNHLCTCGTFLFLKKLASRQPSPAGEGGSHRLTDEVSITVKFSIPLAHRLNPRPPALLCGRADNACTNLLGFFVWYVRTRGMT